MRRLILLGRQIAQCIGRSLLIEERDVLVYLLFHGYLARHMEIHEHLRLDPAIDGLHRRIVRRRPRPRHGTRDAIHRQQLVECLRCINRALVGMENRFAFGMFFANIQQVFQPANVRL